MAEPSSVIVDPLLTIPRQVPNVDIRQLPIGPEEAYVISRVDGASTIRDIGHATGLPMERVEQCIETLERLGAVDFAERPFDPNRREGSACSQVAAKQKNPRIPSASPHIPTAPQTNAVAAGGPSVSEPGAVAGSVSASRWYDPAELLEECDLDPERRRTILDLYYRLESLDQYQLLGVACDADRKSVKAAYYEHVKVLHPDRYYGKNLGSFQKKLETCFAQLTDAYETLTDPQRRAEYDEYLQSVQDTQALEKSLEQTFTADDLDDLERKLMSELAAQKRDALERASSAATSSAPVATSVPSVPAPAGSTSSSPPRQLSDDERKRALARKLRLSQPNLRIPSMPPPSSSASIPPREHIAEQLKRHYEQGRRNGDQAKLSSLLSEVDSALAEGDASRANQVLKVAQSIAPQSGTVEQRLNAAQAQANAALADTYLKQGLYEEKSQRWAAAARSYERAARGRPTAVLYEAVARCLLEANGDLRAAGEFARKAIALEPERATGHLTLGRIFIAAGMKTSALTSLERARSLDPNNDTVTNLLTRLRHEKQ